MVVYWGCILLPNFLIPPVNTMLNFPGNSGGSCTKVQCGKAASLQHDVTWMGTTRYDEIIKIFFGIFSFFCEKNMRFFELLKL